MKIFITSALALSFISPVFADDVIKWETTSQTCWKSVYKEEYIPGTRENPGYVTSSNEYIEVPCEREKTVVQEKIDDNDCTDGKIAGALLFNHYVKAKKIDNKYSLIGNGEKVKFLYLKKPNIIQENVISFIQDFPRELDLEKYVDYDLQFDKSFVEPLKTILDAIGWNVEKTVNLELFFS